MVSEKDPYDVIGRIERRIRASDQARRDWECARILADAFASNPPSRVLACLDETHAPGCECATLTR